ncbi:MAG: hypothetical protein HW388_418 [Dehalococcoidia bacterium]|nr:hypothetical protein [Dehalococcoidia bacterium]
MDKPTRDKTEEVGAVSASEARDVVGQRDGGQGMGHGMGMGGGISFRDLRAFRSLKSPVFRLYYAAMAGQFAAMNMEMLARSLLIYRITGSATALGVMALANSIPMLLFSLYGGVIADRVQKKYVLLWGMAASGVLTLGIALSLIFGFLSKDIPNSWWILVVAALLKGTVQGLMMPSRQAIIAEIVGEKDLMNAVALGSLEMNVNRLVMPALAGFFVEGFGFEAAYFFIAGMYLVAVVFFALMPLTGTISLRGRGALADVKDGFRYIRNEPTILMVLVFALVIVLLSMPYMSLLPVFTEDILQVGAGGLGVLMSVSGIGAIAGSLVLASLPNKRRGLMLIVGSLVLGLGLTGFSFSSAWSLSLAMIVVIGLGQTVRMTLSNTLLQYYTDDEHRGRVMSVYMMEFGLTSFMAFFAAVMTDYIGVQWAVGGLAILLVILCVLALAFMPRMRKLD